MEQYLHFPRRVEAAKTAIRKRFPNVISVDVEPMTDHLSRPALLAQVTVGTSSTLHWKDVQPIHLVAFQLLRQAEPFKYPYIEFRSKIVKRRAR